MRFCVSLAVWLLLVPLSVVSAESFPIDKSQPTETPQFSVGADVEWRDGSCGQVVAPAQWQTADDAGQWYYVVQFGGPDSLQWLLPEEGLTLTQRTATDR